jgi:putative methanogenesis marker protein 2
MWGKLMEADPWWAGYCSVLVNVNDIAAMGGVPLAMTNVISTSDEEICQQIMQGIKDGVEKFGVPMVGGHVHPDTPYNALDVSITGIIDVDDVITSAGARPGDHILVAIDVDGRIHPKFKLNWDTTTMKSSKLVQDQIAVMNKIAHQKLVTSGRDISNPGAIGTLGMLLEASGNGGTIELSKIPKNDTVEWDDWLKMYPGAGFVLTASEDNVQDCIDALEKVNLSCADVGIVTDNKKLEIGFKGQNEIIFDFQKDKIMGIREEVPGGN